MHKHSTQSPFSTPNVLNKVLDQENDDEDNDSFIIQDQSLVAERFKNDSRAMRNSPEHFQNQIESTDLVPDGKIDGEIGKEARGVAIFDPYNPSRDRPSLIDDDEQSVRTTKTVDCFETTTRSSVPGVIGFLEMEEEPSRIPALQYGTEPNDNILFSSVQSKQRHQQANETGIVDPILTSSGLLLTHRKVVSPPARSATSQANADINYHKRDEFLPISRPQHDMISFDDSLSQQSSRQQNVFGPFSMSPSHLKTSKKNDDEFHRQQPRPKPSNLEFESISRSYSWFGRRNDRNEDDPNWTILHQLGRTLSYVRLWVIASTVVLIVGTLVIVKHTVRSARLNPKNNFRPSNNKISRLNRNVEVGFFPDPDGNTDEEKIILLPLPDFALDGKESSHSFQFDRSRHFVNPHNRRLSLLNHHLDTRPHHDNHITYTQHLRSAFDEWIKLHDKQYNDDHEKENRFHVWSHNHRRTEEKNERHGPCQMTGKAVFGSNHFKDLTHEEFKSQYLTGYTGPRTDQEPKNHQSSGVLGPHIPTARHPDVHRRITETNAKWWTKFTNDDSDGDSDTKHWWSSYTYSNSDSTVSYTSSSAPNCDWYDVSCLLQYIFSTYFYGIGGTMEPAYDADSYPTAVDWRDVGAVTDIRSQGSCGGCWAITAVETVESATFIATGKLYTLSETEVIACTQDCEMCSGGWPQDAFEYIIEHNGVPLRSDMSYNANFLYKLTEARSGGSDEIDETTLNAYLYATCRSGEGGEADNHGANEVDNGDYSFTLNEYKRYGVIRGYGYATKKCVCYTNGSGCDCTNQNEGYAIRNLATYGPAVVCLDASTWQDYSGGILTADSGCSSGFMDVNHCVQAVGYAFYGDDDNGREGGGEDNHGGSHDNKNSRDESDSKRNGYWIIKNQWSTYWGMNGYAYVAMGSNTCGILNDMVQVYT